MCSSCVTLWKCVYRVSHALAHLSKIVTQIASLHHLTQASCLRHHLTATLKSGMQTPPVRWKVQARQKIQTSRIPYSFITRQHFDSSTSDAMWKEGAVEGSRLYR